MTQRDRFQKWYNKKHNRTERICPECGEPFVGRANKKFCTETCQSRFWEKTHPRRMRNTEEGLLKITKQMVRAEEGLDRPKPARVHNRLCNCPRCRDARQQARLEIARQTIAAIAAGG